MTLADKIVVLNNGEVEQIASPEELYNHPKTQFVAGFIGSPRMNFLSGDIITESEIDVYGIRPEHVKVAASRGRIKAPLRHSENLGADVLYYFHTQDGQQVVVKTDAHKSYTKGDEFFLDYDDKDLHRFENGITV